MMRKQKGKRGLLNIDNSAVDLTPDVHSRPLRSISFTKSASGSQLSDTHIDSESTCELSVRHKGELLLLNPMSTFVGPFFRTDSQRVPCESVIMEDLLCSSPNPLEPKRKKCDSPEIAAIVQRPSLGRAETLNTSLSEQDTTDLLECHETIRPDGPCPFLLCEPAESAKGSEEEPSRPWEEDEAGPEPEPIESEIVKFLVAREPAYHINPFYLEEKQHEINGKMMAVLIDWMMEVCMEFRLKRDTFHYSVNYVNRYMSSTEQEVTKVQLQLIGLSSMSLASKLEEVYAPRLVDFAKSAADGYVVEQIQQMEKQMASVSCGTIISARCSSGCLRHPRCSHGPTGT